MILVDTSIWIDHIRVANPQLGLLLMQGMVNQHPFVTAELALGSLANRGEVIGQLRLLPQAKVVGHEDLMVFLEGADLSAKGIGLVDAQVLASTVQTPNARLWTRDRRLLAQADRLGVAFDAMKRIPTQMRGGGGLREQALDWGKTIFLHTGWAGKYDGTEAPKGGHAYLQAAVGVEAANFMPDGGWCYGYAPVSRTSKGRKLSRIPEADRTLKIDKLGARGHQTEIDGITVVWTAKKPGRGPVIVGLYRNATVCRYMPPDTQEQRPFIAKARVENCYLVPLAHRSFDVPHGEKGFPGMAAAWFPGEHKDGPAREFLIEAASYLATLE